MVGTYSQIGVYYGIEYVVDQETKEPAVDATAELVNALRDAGLLCQLNGYYNNRLSFIPPININKENVDEIFAILDKVTGETGEAIDDLRNIAQLGYDEDEDQEELEMSLEEIIEYVRVAALLCHDTFTHPQPTAPEVQKPTLH